MTGAPSRPRRKARVDHTPSFERLALVRILPYDPSIGLYNISYPRPMSVLGQVHVGVQVDVVKPVRVGCRMVGLADAICWPC